LVSAEFIFVSARCAFQAAPRRFSRSELARPAGKNGRRSLQNSWYGLVNARFLARRSDVGACPAEARGLSEDSPPPLPLLLLLLLPLSCRCSVADEGGATTLKEGGGGTSKSTGGDRACRVPSSVVC